MPTAARLFAALMLAAVGFAASVLYVPLLPEGTPAAMLAPLNAILGLLVGWMVTGRLTDGKSYAHAVGHGIRGGAVLLFWVLLLWSVWEMLTLALRRRYAGPAEALEAVADLVARYAMLLLDDPAPGATLLAGAIAAGLLAEWGARRYR